MCVKRIFPFLLLLLAGCNQGFVMPGTGDSNLIVVRDRAEAAYNQENWVTAEREYTYLTKEAPGEAEFWARLGNIQARTNKLDAAVLSYREALVRDSKNNKTWHNLGVVQLRQASNTYIEMLRYTDERDPLHQRARHMAKAINDLLTSDFEPRAK